MRTRIFVLLVVLCVALPLAAAEKPPNGTTISFEGAGSEAISDLTWGLSNSARAGEGGGGGAGKVTFNDIHFTKSMSSSSQALFKACARGEHFKEVVITAKKGNTYYKVTLENVFVSSYNVSSGGDTPSEEVTLNFASLEFILIGL